MATQRVTLQSAGYTVTGLILLVAVFVFLYGRRTEVATQVLPPVRQTRIGLPVATQTAHSVSQPTQDAAVTAALQNDVISTVPVAPPSLAHSASITDPDLAVLRTRALTFPVQGIAAVQITDTYTQARAAGVPHEALDIMASRGTPVLAVEDGKLAKLFLSKAGGITIYQFDPDGNYAYYYAHLDRYADGIAEGSSLRRGQVIGYVGSTGNASPDAPHLHFAIFKLGPERQWWRGIPLNPYLVWRDPKS